MAKGDLMKKLKNFGHNVRTNSRLEDYINRSVKWGVTAGAVGAASEGIQGGSIADGFVNGAFQGAVAGAAWTAGKAGFAKAGGRLSANVPSSVPATITRARTASGFTTRSYMSSGEHRAAERARVHKMASDERATRRAKRENSNRYGAGVLAITGNVSRVQNTKGIFNLQ